MIFTLGQAANEAGKAKATLLNAIKKGRLSAIKNDKGFWDIDAAELHRVYPKQSSTTKNEQGQTQSNSEVLAAQNELLRLQLEREKEAVTDLRKRLDNESEERRKLTMMLTSQANTPQKPPIQNRGAVGRFKSWLVGNGQEKAQTPPEDKKTA